MFQINTCEFYDSYIATKPLNRTKNRHKMLNHAHALRNINSPNLDQAVNITIEKNT
ncbi:hypothetical protein Hanom_Chr06g00514801 [Helianthus anomalus]